MLEANATNKNTDGIIPENPFVIWKKLAIITLDDERCDCVLSVGRNMIGNIEMVSRCTLRHQCQRLS